MIDHPRRRLHTAFTVLVFAVVFALSSRVLAAYSPMPDLTAAGAITTLKTDANAYPRYSETYNLGATGLRGWIYIGGGSGLDGLQTSQSRQILITVASTPASAVLAVDDVILGVIAAPSGTAVPVFTSDCRKVFGAALTDAEKTGAGNLRVKRWRAGVTTDVNIPMTILGDYTATAPYACPKSTLILANARTKLVSQLLADSNFLSSDWKGAITGLALLSGVTPADPNYAKVQTRLQTYARSLAGQTPNASGLFVWDWGYINLFLSEYYLSTEDTNVLAGINARTVALATYQSRYGTYGHGGALLKTDGSLHGSISGYGPVNQAGIPANIGIVMGKKALLAGGQAIDPEINSAIQRGSDFFAFYVNKGSIPYGEHEPWMEHGSNGKNPLCAVLFGLQGNRQVETEYYARLTVAGYTSREYGHTGQGFSYLWEAMGANMGGPEAVARCLEKSRWHLDLERRSDGSFVYDGAEQYGAGSTADGTYLGASGYYSLNATASYLLTFSLPLHRLYITGKNANPANTLATAEIENAIAAATFKQDCVGYTTTQLIAALSEFDPLARDAAAIQLATCTLTGTEINTLLAMVTAPNASARMAACQTLGLLKNTGAIPLLVQRLHAGPTLSATDEPDVWVRAKAATALRYYPTATSKTQLTPMLTAYTTNANDPENIDWNDPDQVADPVQIANNFLSFALFGDPVYGGQVNNGVNLGSETIKYTPKTLRDAAIKTGLKQPDSISRSGVAKFCNTYLTLADVQALTPDLFEVVTTMTQADQMWAKDARSWGIKTLAKFKAAEGIPMALELQNLPEEQGWSKSGLLNAGLNALTTYGDAARWTLPTLRNYLGTWDPTASEYATLTNTINSIEAAITSPAGINNLVAVASPQLLTTTGAKAITLSGSSCRGGTVTFSNVSSPGHGTLTGTPPNLIYTPAANYSGPDHFTFRVADSLTTSEPGTVSILVSTIAGTGLKGEYYDNADFTNLKLTRTDAQVNFDWGTGSPHASIAADTFSVRWSGLLRVPETGTYTFSTLSSDGTRLYVDGVPALDNFFDQTTKWKDGAAFHLTEGQMVDLQLLYYENTGSAVAKLKWTGPSFAGANGAIITKEWLYDGSGVTNPTPYAHSQSLILTKNTLQPINLTGSGGYLTPLTYAIIMPPTHGVLTGVAPNLTYTPAQNYSGSDSFTFLVNNGTRNSAPATVSLSIMAGQPLSYFWNNAVSGNWSGATTWANSGGGVVMPAAAGDAFYSMNFNKSGTYTATQDLNSGFVFNQLNLAGAVTIAGTHSLAPLGNGPVQPQINQNSSNTVTISVPISLGTTTTFSGTGAGQANLAGLISGAGGLVKNSLGTLKVYGYPVANTFSGGTTINQGTLHWGTMDGSVSPLINAALGSGAITINPGGTLEFERVDNATNVLICNGGRVFSNNGWGAKWSGPVTLNTDSTVDATWNMTFNGTISGSGGMIKTGGRFLYLTGTNSYTGVNRITDGTLSCSQAAALGTGPLDIRNSAIVDLTYTGTQKVAALTLGGISQAPGTYGSTASPAANKNNTWFSGKGTVTVLPGTTSALALTGGTAPSDPGMPLTFTVTVTGATPTGNVVFYDGTVLLGTSALNGSFQASLTHSNLASGLHTITGHYLGNANNAPSASNKLAIQITNTTPPPPSNLLGTAGNHMASLTWTVSGGATGYYVKRSQTSGGPYTVIGFPAAASYVDESVINGTTYYYRVSAINAAGESADSDEVSVIPPLVATTMTLESSLASGDYGTAVTFTATVAALGGPPTGTVTFKDGASLLRTVSLEGNPLHATFSMSTLAAGSHSITATYDGDAAFLPSTSSSLTYAVSAKQLSISGVIAAGKMYDGTKMATLSGGSLSVGVVRGETVTVVAGTGAFANANVGTWAVTATGYVLGGANAANYVLTGQPTVPNAKITARPLQISGTRPYDGTTTAVADILTVQNNVDGTNLLLTGGASLAGKDVGTHALSTETAAILVQSAIGNTSTGTGTTFNLNLNGAPGSATFNTETPTTLALTGSAAANYTLDGATGSVDITPAELSVIANDLSKIFGQTVTFGSGSTQFASIGLQSGETIGSVTLACLGGSEEATVLGSPYPITPSAATGGTFTAGNYSITYLPGLLTVNHPTYEAWALDPAQDLTVGVNDGPLDDPDHDGYSNLLEFALGGAPMMSSQEIQPKLSNSGDGWVFQYDRSDLSLAPATTQVVEYGSDLIGWTPVAIPTTSAGIVTITPGSPSDHVKVSIPALGGQIFARLKVNQ